MDIQDTIRRAELGDVEAMEQMVQIILWEEGPNSELDPEMEKKALSYVKKAIKAGSSVAMNQLGAMYYEGRGVKQSYKKAIEWYTKAANKGSILAMSNLGYCYYYGRDIPVDMEKAYMYFTKSAMLGEVLSLHKVGDMYMNGYYVEKDPDAAVQLYIQSYMQAKDHLDEEYWQEIYSDACLRLGKCHHYGTGLKKDLREAERLMVDAKYYFSLRVERGDPYAGEGLQKSREEFRKIEEEIGDL